MSGLFWKEYVQKRFNAHKNLIRVLQYHGIEIPEWFNPENVDQFRVLWKEKVNPGDRRGVLEADAAPLMFNSQNGNKFFISFIPSDLSKPKVKKSTVVTHLLGFFAQASGLSGEDVVKSQIALIPDAHCILYSWGELEGSAKNEITEFNTLLVNPIRHFTIDELQFDPTRHMLGPESIELVPPEEVRVLIDSQKDLKVGRNRLAPDLDARLQNLDTEFEKMTLINETDEELLDKLPTINTSDPWVKWRGFKVGDILKITRRFGESKICYRRVVLVERIVKPPKKTKVGTNK